MRNQFPPPLKVRNQLFHSEVCVAAFEPLAFAAQNGEKLARDLNRKLVGDLNRKLVVDLNRNQRVAGALHVSNRIDF